MGEGEKIRNLADFKRDSATELRNLVGELNAHNQDHSPGANMGKMLGGFLSAVVDGEEPDAQKTRTDIALETADEARTALAELQTKYASVLTRFGLSLSHKESEGLHAGLPSGPISARVRDVQTFLRYVRSAEPVVGPEHAEEPFKTLLAIVQEQIANMDFVRTLPNDRDLIANLDPLLESFVRAAPSLNVRRLRNYANFQKTDRLENYLIVEREGLWEMPGEGFGPADWIRDTTPQILETNWVNALETLHSQDEKGPDGVGPELREHLQLCIQKALERLESAPWPDEGNVPRRTILNTYLRRLEAQ